MASILAFYIKLVVAWTFGRPCGAFDFQSRGRRGLADLAVATVQVANLNG